MEEEFPINSQIKSPRTFSQENFALGFEVIYLKSFMGEQTESCSALFPWKLKHGGINCCFGTSKPGTDIQSPS